MNRGITAPDQLGATKLRQLVPVSFEHIKRVAVFEVLERHDPVPKLGPEVPSESAGAEDEPVVVEAVEHAKSLGGDPETSFIDGTLTCETGKHPVSRAGREQLPLDLLNSGKLLVAQICVEHVCFTDGLAKQAQVEGKVGGERLRPPVQRVVDREPHKRAVDQGFENGGRDRQ
jgi:hypothetical protein